MFVCLLVCSTSFVFAHSQDFLLSSCFFLVHILFLVPHVKLQSGRLNDEEGMRHQIDHAVGLYDSSETSRVSEHSLASAYHILATSFMTTVSTDTDSV